MKAFREYLAESKKTFDFRVRIANCELTDELIDRIERGLSQFDLNDMTKPKSQPIARTNEFSQLGPVAREQFEVSVNYPATSEAVRFAIHQYAGIPITQIMVRSPGEDDSIADIESATAEKPGEALLNKEELGGNDTDSQDHVGLNRISNLLKELGKEKNDPVAQTGINDAILAKSVHKEKAAKTTADLPQGNTSPLGSKKQSPAKGR